MDNLTGIEPQTDEERVAEAAPALLAACEVAIDALQVVVKDEKWKRLRPVVTQLDEAIYNALTTDDKLAADERTTKMTENFLIYQDKVSEELQKKAEKDFDALTNEVKVLLHDCEARGQIRADVRLSNIEYKLADVMKKFTRASVSRHVFISFCDNKHF